MSSDLEHELISNVATILERTGNHTRTLEILLKKQDLTNGRVTHLEGDMREIKGAVGELESNDHTQDKKIESGNKLVEMVKNNWKGAAFIIAIVLWVYEHGFIHLK